MAQLTEDVPEPPSSFPSSSSASEHRRHPLLLWFDLLDSPLITANNDNSINRRDGVGPLFLRCLSLGSYYFLLFACSWFVLRRLRRGRPWARARSFLIGEEDSTAAAAAAAKVGVVHAGATKSVSSPPLLLYKETARTRRLLSKTLVLRRPYVPSPWLGHRVSTAEKRPGEGLAFSLPRVL